MKKPDKIIASGTRMDPNADIRQGIDGVPYIDPPRRCSRDPTLPTVWKME